MSLLSYTELCELVEQGVINAPLENINGSSIDLTLSNSIRVESNLGLNIDVDLFAKQSINTHEVIIGDEGYVLTPGSFILASSVETFNLPDNIAAEFVLKSSQARNGWQHCNAGFCDQMWSNSQLTFEYYNVCNYHNLILRPGMKAGQIKFYKTTPVPHDKSYAIKGQYNNQSGATASLGIR